MRCLNCPAVLRHCNRTGYCQHCSRRLQCPICSTPTTEKGDGKGYCLACCAVRDAIAAAHADDHATPHPEAKSRVEVYAARAARGEPLFEEG